MRVFKTREFNRFARREGLGDKRLAEAADRAERGLVDADLGRGLIKQRIARKGQGRSAGFRTLLAFRAKARVVFVYGFAKSERDNIGPDELEFWKRVAGAFLALDERQIDELLGSKEIMEVARNGED